MKTCPIHNKNTGATYIQEGKVRLSISLSYVKNTSEKLRRVTTTHKIKTTFSPPSFAINYFINLKMDLI